MNKAKVFVSVIIALVVSFLGLSRTDLASGKAAPLSKEDKNKLSLSERGDNEFCSVDIKTDEKNPLFINCAGFLE